MSRTSSLTSSRVVAAFLALLLSGAAQAQIYNPGVSQQGFATPGVGIPTNIATDLNQASGGSTLLPFASTTGISTGMVVAGTSITAGTTVSSIVSTAQITQAANGSFAGTQKIIPMATTAGFATGQQCHDTTLSTVIGDGNVIASIQANTSITMTANVNASSGAADSITCDPVVTLSATSTGTISSAATISFYANATAIGAGGTLNVLGGASIAGKLYAGQVVGSIVTAGPVAAVNTGTASNQTGVLQVNTDSTSTTAQSSGIQFQRWTADASGQQFVLVKSRGATTGTNTTVQTGDRLGNILAQGADGTNYANAVQIQFNAEGTVGVGQVPGNMIVKTANSGGTLVTALTIDSAQVVTFGGGMTNTHLSTGTNADFLCLSAAGVFLLQTSACTISSMRFKDLARPFKESAVAKLAKLEPWYFTMKDQERNADPNASRLQVGLLAEDVAQAMPECAIYEDDMATPKSYRQECVIAELVAAVQEQQRQIAALRRR